MNRGLTLEECLALCEAPRKLPVNASRFQLSKHLRDEILIRLAYGTFARIRELLKVDITDADFKYCSILIRHPKGKAVFKIVDGDREHVDTVHQERYVHFDEFTRDLIIRYLEGRKKGPLILSSHGKRMSTREAERIVDHYARTIRIQKVIGKTKNGREVQLVTCKALREAGERHTDINGGDRDTTARVAGHTVRTKEEYYKKGNFEEDREVIRKYHPLMRKKNEIAFKDDKKLVR